MKKRSDRLRKIVVLAKSEEQRECQEMGKIQNLLDEETSRLAELESYRKSYAQGFCASGKINPFRLQDFKNFMRRIDLAVDAQKLQVLSGRENREAHRRRWMAKRQKLESLERAIDRYVQTEHLEHERQAQKVLDELSLTSQPGRSASEI
jgi:flagellar protein FliJ